jgi:hypothetical protein
MPESRSKYEFYKEASLSQQLAHRHPEYSEYAGADTKISLVLALFNILAKHGKINLEEPGWKFIKDLLNEQRKAIFATSEKVNEITKMGLQMPKSEEDFFRSDENVSETDT